MQKIEDVRKIAVLRANSLGDFVFCLPALEALRAAYPQAEIIYLGKPWHKEFLAGRASPIDRVVVVPVTSGIRIEVGQEENHQEVAGFLAQMRSEQLDIALQLHGGGLHSNPFVRQFGARLAAGFHTPDAQPLDISLPYPNFQNEIIKYLELAQKLGAPPVTIVPKIALADRDLEEARRALRGTHGPFIVLHVGAHDPRRRWPPQSFAAVGHHFAAAGYGIVLTAGSDETEAARSAAESMSAPARNLAGRLSLSGLTGLMSQAALVISNDTGPLHLADALGRPTVGLYWVGNLINYGSLYREMHVPLVSWTVICPECGRSCIIGNLPGNSPARCSHVCTFIADIPVDDVVTSAESLLSMVPVNYGTEIRDGKIASEGP